MPNFRYRALTQNGEIVHGTLSAPSAREVAARIEYLKLLPIETIEEKKKAASGSFGLGMLNQPSSAEVTTFTRDLALLLKAGARLDDALELLAADADVGRLRPVVGKLRAALLSGENFADAVAAHPALFPAMYVALVRVGDVSGTLDQVLEAIGAERARSEQMRRKLTDAMQYPAVVLVAAGGVMLFFLLFVLPLAAAALIAAIWWLLRRPGARSAIVGAAARVPGLAGIFQFYRTTLFCRNLGVLLGSGVSLTGTLRILVDIMAVTGNAAGWSAAADRVRHGGKLSDALSADSSLPPMALRMLRLGEETGQLPVLAGRVAEFYEARLQRSLDRIVGIIGPLAIVTISTVVGGLIVSVMTALLSVTQLVG
ncbi:MAG: type II secretion system F family protein [Bradyrhizobium sp.]|uniref:type II secretion system F family protein n=1 Tax=Bradyrhizobium sp. TaxID=376 RepID=UPI003C79C00E